MPGRKSVPPTASSKGPKVPFMAPSGTGKGMSKKGKKGC